MPKVRITKEFVFEMAHALLGYNGPCKNIHGHTYHLLVTITGEILSDDNASEDGMVMDFGDLKKIVFAEIIEKMDHALVLNENVPDELIKQLSASHKVFTKPYQPTCENLLVDFAEIIQSKLPDIVKLHHLLLRETMTSYAEWYADDNIT